MKKREINHPTIKEINIGDRFLLKDNKTIVEFVPSTTVINTFSVKCINYPIEFESCKSYYKWVYDITDLTFRRHKSMYEQYKHLDIKCKLPSLKEKLDLL